MGDSHTYNTILLEHQFWLQIMGDHSRFIFFSLAANEVEYLQRAQDFIIGFDQLLEQSKDLTTEKELEIINKQAYHLLLQFKDFKLILLSLTLNSKIKIHLSSSFINDMLNELEEYMNILYALSTKDNLISSPIHYHLIWLNDAMGHAGSLTANLDFIEKDMINKSISYEMEFTDLFIKANIMKGFLRTQLDNFPSLNKLNQQVEKTITSFKTFLEDLRDERINGRILGTLFPLMADHMVREECYYLWKISQTTGLTKRLDCEIASPRIQ